MQNFGIEVREASGESINLEETINSGETINSEGGRMVDKWKDSRRNNFFKNLMLVEIFIYLYSTHDIIK